MIFGSSKSIAVEAIVEPGPEYSAVACSNVAGRICLHIGGNILGDYTEPSCILGCVRDHLIEIGNAKGLWHEALAGLNAAEQFRILEELIYGERPTPRLQEALGDCAFLTNQSEAFDSVKAFLVRPPGFKYIVLVEISGTVQSFLVPVAEFHAVSRDFSDWLVRQEDLLLR